MMKRIRAMMEQPRAWVRSVRAAGAQRAEQRRRKLAADRRHGAQPVPHDTMSTLERLALASGLAGAVFNVFMFGIGAKLDAAAASAELLGALWLLRVAAAALNAASYDLIAVATVQGMRAGRRSRYGYGVAVAAALVSAAIGLDVAGVIDAPALHAASSIVVVAFMFHLLTPMAAEVYRQRLARILRRGARRINALRRMVRSQAAEIAHKDSVFEQARKAYAQNIAQIAQDAEQARETHAQVTRDLEEVRSQASDRLSEIEQVRRAARDAAENAQRHRVGLEVELEQVRSVAQQAAGNAQNMIAAARAETDQARAELEEVRIQVADITDSLRALTAAERELGDVREDNANLRAELEEMRNTYKEERRNAQHNVVYREQQLAEALRQLELRQQEIEQMRSRPAEDVLEIAGRAWKLRRLAEALGMPESTLRARLRVAEQVPTNGHVLEEV